MALLSSVINSLASPTVSFTDAKSGALIWQNLKIASVDIMSEAGVTDSPVSLKNTTTNQTPTLTSLATDINAAKVLLPTHIRINAMVANLSDLESILSVFSSYTDTLTVISKSFVAFKMAISEIDVDMSGDMLSANRVTITLEQVLAPNAGQATPSQPPDLATLGQGLQSLVSSASSAVSGLATKAVNLLKAGF